jgi:hypothetical protein
MMEEGWTMPYIDKTKRIKLDNLIGQLGYEVRQFNLPMKDGAVNYAITKLLLNAFTDEVGYASYARMIGALECAKLELYRRKLAPYEDKKKEENGDVY